MEMIIPIMLATSPIWLILGFISWLIARDYETLRSERLRNRRQFNDEDIEMPPHPSVPVTLDIKEVTRHNSFKESTNENVEAPKSQYVPVGFRSVGNVDIGEKAEDSNGTVGNTAKWLGR